jgi:hypothetical protein
MHAFQSITDQAKVKHGQAGDDHPLTVLVGGLYHLPDLVEGEVLAGLDGHPLDVDVGDLALRRRRRQRSQDSVYLCLSKRTDAN